MDYFNWHRHHTENDGVAPAVAEEKLNLLSGFIREPLINSESFSCAGKIPERRHFNKQMLIHELIGGSLDHCRWNRPSGSAT